MSDHGGEGGVVSNSISRNRPDIAACIGSDDSRGSEVTLVRGAPGTIVAVAADASSAVDFMFVVELWKK